MSSLYLAIESATKMCSVALFQDDLLIDKEEEGGEYSHAEKLAPFVDQILRRNKLKAKDLSAIAISSGPGSYTGLRIGLSLAKGICFSSNLPLISISTLRAMAAGASSFINDKNGFYVPMIDARRMEVYTSVFNSELNVIEVLEAKIIDEDSYRNQPDSQKLYVFGDGAEKCKGIIKHDSIEYLENEFISASNWGPLIHQKFNNKEFENLAYYEPLYHKSFKAGKPKPLL